MSWPIGLAVNVALLMLCVAFPWAIIPVGLLYIAAWRS